MVRLTYKFSQVTRLIHGLKKVIFISLDSGFTTTSQKMFQATIEIALARF